MEFLFVRHAQSMSNAGLITPEQLSMGVENGLTKAGVLQAQNLAQKLLLLPKLTTFYHSGILRATQTCEILHSSFPDIPMHQDSKFKEIDPGIIPVEEMNLREKTYRQALTGTLEKLYPGGESITMARNRSLAAIQELSKKYTEKEIVLIVTHSELIKALFNPLLVTANTTIRTENCSLFKVGFNDEISQVTSVVKL
jgi:broad specificity phosphatase PhoE